MNKHIKLVGYCCGSLLLSSVLLGCVSTNNTNLDIPQDTIEKSREYTPTEVQSIYEHIPKKKKQTLSISDSKLKFDKEISFAFEDIKGYKKILKKRERVHLSKGNGKTARFGKNRLLSPHKHTKVTHNSNVSDGFEHGSPRDSSIEIDAVSSITKYY